MKELSIEMFNIHTSMTTANEEIIRLPCVINELSITNEELELMIESMDSLKQENEYLKNKIICSEQIEKFLKNKFLKMS